MVPNEGEPDAFDGGAACNGIPIRMLNNAGTSVTITSVTFNLTYDSTLLSVTGATLPSGVPTDATLTINTSAHRKRETMPSTFSRVGVTPCVL